MTRRGCRHDVGDQAFIPSPDGEIHIKPIIRTPMPVQFILTVGMPVPVGCSPHLVNSSSQVYFTGIIALKIFFGTKKTHQQIGCFHEVRCIIQPVKFYSLTRSSIHEVRIYAVKTICIDQKIGDLDQSPHGSISPDPFPFYCNDGTHDAKAGTTDRASIRTKFCLTEIRFIPGLINIIPIMFCKDSVTSFEGETTYRMRVMPEKSKSLSFYHLQQSRVGKIFYNADRSN